MPWSWKRGENPYRMNYFGILELGPGAQPSVINATRGQLVTGMEHGTVHEVDGRAMTEAEVNEAAARLMDDASWAQEVLLVHPAPAGGRRRLQQICTAISQETTPDFAPQPLQLVDLRALAPLLPAPCAEDVAWPEWEELELPARVCALDVQFDL